MQQDTQNQLMTVGEVIAEMAISRSTWQKLVTRKQTPPIIRIAGAQRVRRNAFTKWLIEQESAC